MALNPKITDFGLARIVDGQEQSTRTGALLGTPSYMAPEQVAGDKSLIGPATDVYSLGVMLYEFLTGRLPFQGTTVAETLQQVRTAEPLPPSRLQPSIPRDLQTICLKCLEKSPARRYAAAEALAEDLDRFLESRPIHARPISAAGRLAKWIRRRPAVAALSAVIVIVCIAAFGVVTWQWRETAGALRDKLDAEQAERQHFATQQIATAERNWTAGDLPGTRELLGDVLPRYRDEKWRFLENACRAEACSIELPTKGSIRLNWSADGRRIATWWTDGTSQDVCIYDAQTGAKVMTCPTGLVVHEVAIHANGREFVSFGRPSKLRVRNERLLGVWDLANGRPLRRWKIAVWTGHGYFNRDGTHFASHTSPGQVTIWDTGTGESITLDDEERANLSGWALSRDARILATTDKAGMLKIWDLHERSLVRRLDINAHTTSKLAFSDNGQWLIWTGISRTVPVRVQAWSLPDGKRTLSYQGTAMVLPHCAISPDGRMLAIEGADQARLELWHTAAGRQVMTLRGHSPRIVAVAFSPTGNRLATAATDGTLKIWDVSPWTRRPSDSGRK